MNTIDVSQPDADGGAMVAALLCRVREVQGLPAALDMARAMIVGGAAILARERGADHARRVLDLAAQALQR